MSEGAGEEEGGRETWMGEGDGKPLNTVLLPTSPAHSHTCTYIPRQQRRVRGRLCHSVVPKFMCGTRRGRRRRRRVGGDIEGPKVMAQGAWCLVCVDLLAHQCSRPKPMWGDRAWAKHISCYYDGMGSIIEGLLCIAAGSGGGGGGQGRKGQVQRH